MSITREKLNELMTQVAKDTCCYYTQRTFAMNMRKVN